MALAYFFKRLLRRNVYFFKRLCIAKVVFSGLLFKFICKKKTTEPCGWVAFRECEVVSSFYFSLSTCAERAGR